MAAPPVCGISLEPFNKWKVVNITTHNVNFPSYVFVQGSIFGVSSDFSYNENGLHPFTSFIFIQWCGFSFYQDTLTSSQVELWMELLVCHRQTRNLESDFHHAGLFWKWHFCSVTWWDSVRVVQTERTFQSRATVGRPPVDLGDDTFGNTVFLGRVFVFTPPGQHSRRRCLTVYTPVTDHVSRDLVCSKVARHAEAQLNQRSTTNYQLPTTGWCVIINRPESMVQQLQVMGVTNGPCSCLIPSNNVQAFGPLIWCLILHIISVKSKRNNHKEKLHSEGLEEFCET